MGCRFRSSLHEDNLIFSVVRQHAPESRMGLAGLGLLYRKVVCFDVCNLEFRGVYNRRHDNTPCPRILPMSMGAASCGASQCAGKVCSVEGGTSPDRSFIVCVCPTGLGAPQGPTPCLWHRALERLRSPSPCSIRNQIPQPHLGQALRWLSTAVRGC